MLLYFLLLMFLIMRVIKFSDLESICTVLRNILLNNLAICFFVFWLVFTLIIGCIAWGNAKEKELYKDIIHFELSNLNFPGCSVTLLSRIVFGFKFWHYYFYLMCEDNREIQKKIFNSIKENNNSIEENKMKEIEESYISIAIKRDIILYCFLVFEISLLYFLVCIENDSSFFQSCIIHISVAYASFRVLAIFFGFLGDIIFREKKYRSVLWKHLGGDRQVISNSRNLLIALVGLWQIYVCFSILWSAEYAINNRCCLNSTKTFFDWIIESVKHSTFSNLSENSILNLIQFFTTSSYLLLFVSFYLSEINSKEFESKTE